MFIDVLESQRKIREFEGDVANVLLKSLPQYSGKPNYTSFKDKTTPFSGNLEVYIELEGEKLKCILSFSKQLINNWQVNTIKVEKGEKTYKFSTLPDIVFSIDDKAKIHLQ